MAAFFTAVVRSPGTGIILVTEMTASFTLLLPMLSACFDARVMRSDRGYWCLPEVDLGLPFSDGMTAAVTARLPADAAHDAMITGRRYTAEEALALGIVTDTSDEARLLDLAIDLAAPIAGKDRNVIGEHKRLLFGEAARRCGFEARTAA